MLKLFDTVTYKNVLPGTLPKERFLVLEGNSGVSQILRMTEYSYLLLIWTLFSRPAWNHQFQGIPLLLFLVSVYHGPKQYCWEDSRWFIGKF